MEIEALKLLIEVFGPAAVTLILLLVAINKMWPQLIEDQQQTRIANAALVETLREVVSNNLQALSQMEERLARQHERFERALDRKERMSQERHDEYMRAFGSINESLDGIAKRLNGK